MKNLMLTLMFVLATLSVTVAQERGQGRQGGNPEDRAKMEVQRLQKELNLSQTQQDSILNYLLAANKEQRKAIEQADGDRKAAFEKMKGQREARTAKIKSFLTNEQAEKYDALLQKRQENRPQQRKENP